MVAVIVIALTAFRVTVPEAETEITCLQTKDGGRGCRSTLLQSARCTDKRSSLSIWSGAIDAKSGSQRRSNASNPEDMDVLRAVFRWRSRAGVHSRLKVRVLKAEVIETIRHRCVTWNSKPADYDRGDHCLIFSWQCRGSAHGMPQHCHSMPRQPMAVPTACRHMPRQVVAARDKYHGIPRNDYRGKLYDNQHGNPHATSRQTPQQTVSPAVRHRNVHGVLRQYPRQHPRKYSRQGARQARTYHHSKGRGRARAARPAARPSGNRVPDGLPEES